MSYYYAKTLKIDFETAIAAVTSELKNEGFGVLADINIQSAIKNKLGVEYRKYRILGACNPPFAIRALEADDKIGTLLPCNVILQETGEGEVEVAAIDPVQSMLVVGNKKLTKVAEEIAEKLKRVIKNL